MEKRRLSDTGRRFGEDGNKIFILVIGESNAVNPGIGGGASDRAGVVWVLAGRGSWFAGGRSTVHGSSDLFRPSAALGLKGREMEGKSLTSKSAI